jgi:hypothetical protein
MGGGSRQPHPHASTRIAGAAQESDDLQLAQLMRAHGDEELADGWGNTFLPGAKHEPKI